MSEGDKRGFGGSFLRDAQGIGVLVDYHVIDRAEARENLRRQYSMHLPEVKLDLGFDLEDPEDNDFIPYDENGEPHIPDFPEEDLPDDEH